MAVRRPVPRVRVLALLLALVVGGSLLGANPAPVDAATKRPGDVVPTAVRQTMTQAAILTPEIELALSEAQTAGALGPAVPLGQVLDDRTRVRNTTQPWYSGGTLTWKSGCGKRDNDLKALDRKKRLAGWCWPAAEQESGSLRRSNWVPQGIASTREASASGLVAGRRATAVSWYAGSGGRATEVGSRVTFFRTPGARSSVPFTHVTLAQPITNGDNLLDLRPVFAHAGGIAWSGPYLFVPQTGFGIRVFDVRRIHLVENGPELGASLDGGVLQGGGARYVMLEVARYGQLGGALGCRGARLLPLCFSTVSIDRSVAPPRLVVAEYLTQRDMKRLRRGAGIARWVLRPDGLPLADATGVATSDPVSISYTYATQGLVAIGSTSQYYFSAGDIGKGWFVWERTGDRRRPVITQGWPRGPQSLTRDPVTRRLWSVSEVPGRRTVFWVNECEMRRLKGRCTG